MSVTDGHIDSQTEWPLAMHRFSRDFGRGRTKKCVVKVCQFGAGHCDSGGMVCIISKCHLSFVVSRTQNNTWDRFQD